MWNPSEKEISSVSELDAPARYEYCVKRIADHQLLYSLKNESGWVLAGDDSGRELVPVWPHAAFASLCAAGSWGGCRPEAIGIDEWLARWIPGTARDGRMVAVFPTARYQGVAVDPARFEGDIRAELSKYD
jgi:hypothetical protein